MHKIYLITNLVNGKTYVGQTARSVVVRWRDHMSTAKRGENHYLYKAIRKYGKNAFSVQEVYATDSSISANEMEKLWIVVFRASERKYGYNGSVGGNGWYCPNSETLQKRSRALLKTFKNPEQHPSFKPEFSNIEITRLYQEEKLSQRKIAAKLGCTRELVAHRLRMCKIPCRPVGGPPTGWKHTEETKLKMRTKHSFKTGDC